MKVAVEVAVDEGERVAERKRGGLRRDQRGAVLAEFVIAILPILTAFFTFVQLAHIAAARLVLKHGAVVASRGAAVITNGHGNNPGQENGENKEQVTAAAEAAMAPWVAKGNFTNVDAQITDQSSEEDPYGWVTVRVDATYHCTVLTGPMGAIACAGRTKQMSQTYRMPHQGALYKVD